MPKWTEQQRDAIADRGHSLIVCAAAGSGKTAVLVERIVQLVREGCPIENMLVVTFTNAAAGEMRQRIGEALGKAAREDPALGEQVMALSRASISTLHRFCGNLLREHFQALSIDPGFRIGDEQECGVLSHQAMEDAIYSCYEVGSDAFLAADRCYTQEELSELAFALHRFMMTRPDPWAFLARAQETVRLTGEGNAFPEGLSVGQGIAPEGAIIAWMGESSPGEGWALCDGTNGTPDLTGRFIVGTRPNGSYALAEAGGAKTVALTAETMPEHAHPAYVRVPKSPHYHFNTVSLKHGQSVWGRGTSTTEIATLNAAGGDGAHENLPPYCVVRFYMKKGGAK